MHIKRILHVEDDDTTKLEIKAVLKDVAELVQVSSVKEAANLINNESFDLVLLDFTLPDGSGQGLLKIINSLPLPPPVIVLSGHELIKNIPGVVKVLTKGRFEHDDFIKLVKSTLNGE